MIKASTVMVVLTSLILLFASATGRLKDPEALLITNATMLAAIVFALLEIAEKLS